MKKVILTGASGFIGKALLHYLLESQNEVYAIVRDSQKLVEFSNYPNLKIITCDMSEYGTLPSKITERNFDVCYHLAWEGAMGANIQNLAVQNKNIICTANLFDAMQELNIKSIIFADTISQYKYIPISETPKINKNFDVYGLAKAFTRNYLLQKCSSASIRFNSVLFANVFGVGDHSKRSTNIIIDKFLKNESPNLANGSILYDWTYIDDVVKGVQSVAEKGISYKSYYIGHRKLKTLEEIITSVRDVVNPQIPLTFSTYHDVSFIDYDQFFNDDLYQDTGYEITSDFSANIKKTMNWVKSLNW